MEREPLFIAFSTQKGGMGKTTLTVLAASYLHYVKGINVAVVDCDYPQHSIHEMRERDAEQVMNDEYYKRMAYAQFKTINQKAYPVEESTAADAITTAKQLMDEADVKPDVIFFDLPGTMNSTGVVKTLASMDYIFAPISADRVVMESTLQFAMTLNENLIESGESDIKGLFLIWNMVDGRERSELYHAYDKVIAELDMKVLQTVIPDSKRFRRELTSAHKAVFRSTLFPVDKTLLKGSNVAEMVEEICQIIKL